MAVYQPFNFLISSSLYKRNKRKCDVKLKGNGVEGTIPQSTVKCYNFSVTLPVGWVQGLSIHYAIIQTLKY